MGRVEDKEYLSPPEVAELLGVSLATVKKHLQAGVIPGVKLGRLWRVKRSDLDAAFRRPTPPSPPRRPTRGKG